MRTPAAMIVGMVLAPCGLVLNLTSTVAPNWRSLSGLTDKPTDVVQTQGLWDICQVTVTNQNLQCGLSNTNYFSLKVVQVAQGLMITSLIVTGLGIALASWGVRCWEDIPNFLVSGFGGVVIFISGILSLIPVSWYTSQMYNMLSTDSGETITAGYALVLGYLGSCFEIIAGFSLMLCFVNPCKKCIKTQGKTTSSMYYSKKQTSNKITNPSHISHINTNSPHVDRYQDTFGYSIGNDNYQHGDGSRRTNSVADFPRSYTNPMDVTAGEHSNRYGRPASQLSSLPCDSDLL
ncbi:claudin-23 [Pseudophryne corroboree]|uniref:claudin-23 n=1 Tax=Pseudophryne corroboree TaxID=495146 RepID=UPI003081BF01